MYVKKLKRKCDVRGCRCTESFAISLTREMGNSVIICKSCLGKALGAIDDIDPVTQDNFPAPSTSAAPSLFFNAVALGLKTDNAENTADNQTDDVPPVSDENINDDNTTPQTDDVASENDAENTASDETGFKCPNCGKVFDSERGLTTHLRYCKEQSDEE